MDGYCKLHAKIVTSSIWNEPHHVRLLWVTMLAIADSDGNVEGSPGGLAAIARITHHEAEEALAALSSPDPDSTDETSGERIEKVAPGVWHIINHNRYRERQTRRQALDAARKRRSRADADMSALSADVRGTGVTSTHTQTQYPDTVPSTQTSTQSTPPTGGGCGGRAPKTRSDVRFDEFWSAYPIKQGKKEARAAWGKITDLDDQFDKILEAAKATAVLHRVGDRKIKYPQGWLNGRRWEDELEPQTDKERIAFGETGVRTSDFSGPAVQDF